MIEPRADSAKTAPLLSPHSAHSSSREKVLEHLFVGELLKCLWLKGVYDAELLRADTDAGGYDIVVDNGPGIIRHIQLKTSRRGGKAKRQKVNMKLAEKPSGCVIWIEFNEKTLELGPFWWLGEAPGTKMLKLGNKIAKQTKGDKTGHKSERPNVRVLARGKFTKLATMEKLVERLFGS